MTPLPPPPGIPLSGRLRALVWRAPLLALIWWALAEGRADSWGVGLVTLVLALGASLVLWPPGPGRVSLVGLIRFAGFFLLQSLRGGLQVAALAFAPRPNLAPALVELPMTLPPGPGRVWLANTLNLLPGTVVLNIEGDVLRLHALDARQPLAEEVRVVEGYIARLLGIAP